MEHERSNLSNRTEVATNERACMINEYIAREWRYSESSRVERVQARLEGQFFCFSQAVSDHVAPKVFDEAEENDMQDFHRGVCMCVELCVYE